MTRQFTLTDAVREQVPLLAGIAGPSGSGKTYSALLLAKGMQEVVGGDTIFIDTENRRALHYADDFVFKHLALDPPFGPLDYLEAVQEAARHNPAAIIIDSMSHEHEGEGGVLDMHAAEVDRRSGGDPGKAERVKMLAWQKPKRHRRQLLNGLTRLNTNVIMCFRAGQKAKPNPDRRSKERIIDMGFTPIAGPEFVFEMTLCALLPPNARGVPVWASDKPGEGTATKLPGQFTELFHDGRALDAAHGRALAEWARGGKAKPADAKPTLDMDSLKLEGDVAAQQGTEALKQFWVGLNAAQKTALEDLKDTEWKVTAAEVDERNAKLAG